MAYRPASISLGAGEHRGGLGCGCRVGVTWAEEASVLPSPALWSCLQVLGGIPIPSPSLPQGLPGLPPLSGKRCIIFSLCLLSDECLWVSLCLWVSPSLCLCLCLSTSKLVCSFPCLPVSFGLVLLDSPCISLSLSLFIPSGLPCPSCCLSPPMSVSLSSPLPLQASITRARLTWNISWKFLGPKAGPDQALRCTPSLPCSVSVCGSLAPQDLEVALTQLPLRSCPLLPPQLSPTVFPRRGCGFPTSRPLQAGTPATPLGFPLSSGNQPSGGVSLILLRDEHREPFVLSPSSTCSERGTCYCYCYSGISFGL